MADASQPAPNTTTIDWLSIVLAHDDEFYEPENCYEFSNGRTFENTDKNGSGIYS